MRDSHLDIKLMSFWAMLWPVLTVLYLSVLVTVGLHTTQHRTLLCYCRGKSFQNLDLGKCPFPFPVEGSI